MNLIHGHWKDRSPGRRGGGRGPGGLPGLLLGPGRQDPLRPAPALLFPQLWAAEGVEGARKGVSAAAGSSLLESCPRVCRGRGQPEPESPQRNPGHIPGR